MSDLIDRKMAMKMKFSHGINEDGRLYVPFNEVIRGLKELPTIDAVEVVKCKDCKHRPIIKRWKPNPEINFSVEPPHEEDRYPNNVCPCLTGYDDEYWWQPDDNDFCAYGERRATNDETD